MPAMTKALQTGFLEVPFYECGNKAISYEHMADLFK